MSGSLGHARSKAKEVVVENFRTTTGLAKSAAKSGAYLYPIIGIFYFITHRSLWKPLHSKLIPALSLSLGVLLFMFVFAYLPQLAVLVFFNGPLAAFTTILLTLSQSSALINVISRTFLLPDALVDAFDGVLILRCRQGVVSEGRQVKSGYYADPVAKLGKFWTSPFEKFTLKAVIRYVLYLPLNFIPVVGTVLFVLLQGRHRGNGVHTRYFQLKGWTKLERQQWLKENAAAYAAFGTVATFLELVPVVSIFFTFTNTVGAALWAANIEGYKKPLTDFQIMPLEVIDESEIENE